MSTLREALSGNGLALFAAVWLGLWFVLRFARRGNQTPARQRPFGARATDDRPTITIPRAGAASGSDLDRLEVRMHELERDVGARIDTKLCLLERLIEDSTRAAERLERLLLDVGRAAQEQIPSAASTKPPTEEATQSLRLRHAQLFALADEGYNAAEIARELAIPEAEVTLILNLGNKPRRE